METAKVTAKGQTTIPAAIRKAIHWEAGDVLEFEIEGERLVLRKLSSANDAYLQGLGTTMQEWSSPEDEAAWDVL